MDLLTFIAELFKAGAWPVAAVSIALIFRKQIQALLVRLKKGKFGPAEFEFEEAVRELQQDAVELQLPAASQSSVPTLSQAALEPRAVVLQSWIEVESAIEALAKKHGLLTEGKSPSSSQLVRALKNAEVLKPEYIALFSELRFLRNRAAHERDFNPSAESVQGFARLAKELAAEAHREL